MAGRDRAVAADEADESESPGLRATVVRNEDGPDRCTIHPAEATRDERLVTWLSADADAFLDAEAMR